MRLSPALRATPVLLLLALSGCAPLVPWPPVPGSCIEASLGKGGRPDWRYEIADRRASRADVERMLQASPGGWDAVVWSQRLNTISFLESAGLGGTSVTVAVRRDEPFRRAVLEYNARAAREATCPRPPRRAVTVTDQEVLRPRWGPPPLGQ